MITFEQILDYLLESKKKKLNKNLSSVKSEKNFYGFARGLQDITTEVFCNPTIEEISIIDPPGKTLPFSFPHRPVNKRFCGGWITMQYVYLFDRDKATHMNVLGTCQPPLQKPDWLKLASGDDYFYPMYFTYNETTKVAGVSLADHKEEPRTIKQFIAMCREHPGFKQYTTIVDAGIRRY